MGIPSTEYKGAVGLDRSHIVKMYLSMAHQARKPICTAITAVVIVFLYSPVYGQSAPNRTIDTCDLIRKPRRDQPLIERDASEAHKHFVLKLKDFTKIAKRERKAIQKTWDIPRSLVREHRNHGVRDLHPRRGKRLRMPKNKRVQPLFEAAWWMTSMQKAAYEVYQMNRIDETFTKELETLSTYLYDILYVMKIRVRNPRELCHREQTIEFPLDQVNVTKENLYAYMVLRDIEQGVKRMVKMLRRCKVSVSKNRSRLRCSKKTKSIFYSKKSKTVLGTWLDIST